MVQVQTIVLLFKTLVFIEPHSTGDKMTEIGFQTHSCPACREQFIVACESELQEKLKKHEGSCIAKRTNKKRERTQQFQQHRIALFVHDTAVDRIQQYNFDKLVNSGMLVNG